MYASVSNKLIYIQSFTIICDTLNLLSTQHKIWGHLNIFVLFSPYYTYGVGETWRGNEATHTHKPLDQKPSARATRLPWIGNLSKNDVQNKQVWEECFLGWSMDQGFPTTKGQNLVDLDFLGTLLETSCQAENCDSFGINLQKRVYASTRFNQT